MNIIRLRTTSLVAALIAAFATCALASEPVDCFYGARTAKNDSHGEITRHRRCAIVQNDGTIRILPRHLRALDFGSDGLATLVVAKGRWVYVKQDGATLEVLPLDNGADYFAEGLVRGRRKGKVAFFDHSFRMVLPPQYDFAWPFEGGLASVCSGCREEPADRSESEYHVLSGGLWGYIDHHGKEVIAVRFSRDDAARRKEQLPRK